MKISLKTCGLSLLVFAIALSISSGFMGMDPKPPALAWFDVPVHPLKLEKIFLHCDPDQFSYLYQHPRIDSFIPCRVMYKGKSWNNTEMRLRGDSSRDFTKKSLKIRFKKSNPFSGGKSVLNLNAQVLDSSYIHQILAAMVIRSAGYPCFTASPVVLYLNGQCAGLYTRVENIDDEFLAANKLSKKDNLYKATRDYACMSVFDDIPLLWEKKTHKKTGDFSDLQGLILKLNSVPDNEYYAFVNSTFDYPKMIDMIALNMLLANKSTYYHNYYMYHNLETDKWLMLPWDLDNTLVWEDVSTPYHRGNLSDQWNCKMPSNPFFERALVCPPIFKDIRIRVNELYENHFNLRRLKPSIDQLRKAMSPYIEADSAFCRIPRASWEKAMDEVEKFIERRPQDLQYQFAHAPYSFELIRQQGQAEGEITLRWHPSTDPDGDTLTYALAYSRDMGMKDSSFVKVRGIRDTAYVIAEKLKSGTWYWKVYARDKEFNIAGFDNRNSFVVP